MVCVEAQFEYTTTSKIGSKLLLASTRFNVLLGRGFEKNSMNVSPKPPEPKFGYLSMQFVLIKFGMLYKIHAFETGANPNARAVNP